MDCISSFVPEWLLQGSIIVNIIGLVFSAAVVAKIIFNLVKKKKLLDKMVIITLITFAIIFIVGLLGNYYIGHYSKFHPSKNNSADCAKVK